MRLLVCAVTVAALSLETRATTLLLEAERLELAGGWNASDGLPGARRFLRASPEARGAPAVGAIDLPHAGPWKLWVRSKDYPEQYPGTRTFSVRLGTNSAAILFGRHGQTNDHGWAWEQGGTLTLEAGPQLVVLGDRVNSAARCDAILLTDSTNYQPEGAPEKLGKQAATIVPLNFDEASRRALVAAKPETISETPLATIANGSVRYSFHAAQMDGGSGVVMRIAARVGETWKAAPAVPGAECFWVINRPLAPEPKPSLDAIHPAWDISLAPLVEARVGTASVQTRPGEITAPWLAGHCHPLRPINAMQRDAQTVELSFAATSAGRLTATWHLDERRPMAELALALLPAGPGHYSLGYAAPWETPATNSDFLLLPFMYHGHRFPDRAVTVPSALTPTPLTLVSREGFSCAIAGRPEAIPFEWPGATNSRYVFGLRNAAGLAQPLAFSPVIGQRDSRSDGAPVRASFVLWTEPGSWYATFRGVADHVFGLRDYRRPIEASLSDTALNLFDLLRDEKASGWNARAKGPWNIESRNVVTHASPLTYLSYYLLTGDESFRTNFALPSLEFLLSRPGPHFAAERAIGDNYYRHQPMRGPGAFYGAATHASAYALTRGGTPAFAESCFLSNGTLRVTHAGGHVNAFEDALAMYRLTGEKKWLEQAVAGGDAYIAANLTRLPTRDLGSGPFVNVSFVPDWEGLLHLYEATGERRFLNAAAEGARWLLTTLWTQPCVPDTDVTLHPGGQLDNARHVWWWGDGLFKLGRYEGPASQERIEIPPALLPEKRVPAWTVSNVGLGLEQPCTYTRRDHHANILMSVWAPNLLRLAKATGDTAFRTAARNATIGRFANYPGYYLDAMTDAYRRPDYPLKGPDVTWLYVHHIVPFSAYVADYLFTDAEMRSDGAVQFPSVRQCGYVWFDSRLYGHAPGHVFGHKAWPWLHRTAATVDNVNVDRVLAAGDGAFHVVLMNQVNEPQRTRVRLEAGVLGRTLNDATITRHDAAGKTSSANLSDGTIDIELPPLGLVALTLDGVHIDVATHREEPPTTFALPAAPARRVFRVPGTDLDAIGTEIVVPPATSRQLFVYLAAGLDDVRSATLRYRVGDDAEIVRKLDHFPWEFSERIDDMKAPITWTIDAEKP